MTQVSIFDATAAREEAIARVEENNLDWCDRAYVKLRELAQRQSVVLVEDLKAAMVDDQPRTPSAYGPVLLRAAKEGILRRAPGLRYARSTRSHSERATWVSCIHRAAS